MKFNTYIMLALLLVPSAVHTGPYNLVVTDPVVSLRVTPTEMKPDTEPDVLKSKATFGPSYEKFTQTLQPAHRDPDQDTQLLFNEQIRCLEKLPKGWLKVEALEQYAYNKEKKSWQHIHGYIKDNQATEVKDFQRPDLVVKKPWVNIQIDDDKTLTVPMGTKLHRVKTLRSNFRVALPSGRTGLINQSDVYQMTHQVKESENLLRSSITKTAKKLLGSPYCWGGRSPYTTDKHEKVATSCDCSGLINLAYRTHGLELPRNSRQMYMRAAPVPTGKALRPGDLVFLARPESKKKVIHVLMYMGDDTFLESLSTPGVSLCKSECRFGQPLNTIKNGSTITTTWCSNCSTPAEFVIYFGTYLHDNHRLQHMRNYARGNYDANTWVNTWQKTNKKSKKQLPQSTTQKSDKLPNLQAPKNA